jgi:hypothetical protein
VGKAFVELASMTIPPDASQLQYQECRRFFYAGTLWALTMMEKVADLPNDDDGTRGAMMLALMRSECEEFGRDVKAGRA